MKLFRTYLNNRKVKHFWNYPDEWHALILLENDQVYARIRDGLARIESVPKPGTGYFYQDIVKIDGPIGRNFYRDEEINEYIIKEVHSRSHISTFSFKAIVPAPRYYFRLQDLFRGDELKVRFPWSDKENNTEW